MTKLKPNNRKTSRFNINVLKYASCVFMFFPSVVSAQTVTTDQNFSFGKFALLDFLNVENIDIASGGTVTKTSDIFFIDDPQRGIYTVTDGPPLTNYTVSITDSDDLLIPGTLGTSMSLKNIQSGPENKRTDVNGEAQFWLYGRLETRGNMSYQDQTLTRNIEIEIIFDN
ncbi:MAG: DUF4402 domain-containing protein [Alphaproteobacteria bacterium]